MSEKKEVRGPRHKFHVDAGKLDALRKERGWTIEDFAAATELSESTIKRAIRAPTAEVSYLSADQIAHALDVKLNEIGLRKRIEKSTEEDASAKGRKIGDGPGAFFPNDYLENRYSDLFQLAELFSEAHAERTGLDFEVSPIFLYEATVWAYDEISRQKSYHLSDPTTMKIDTYRSSAVISHALAKFRPIWIRSDIDIGDDRFEGLMNEAPIINELFATYVAIARIEAAEQRHFVVSNEDFYELAYYLRGEGDAKGLELALKSIVAKYLS